MTPRYQEHILENTFWGTTEYKILRYGVLKYDKGNLKQIGFKLLNNLLYTSVFSFPTSMGTGATI